MSLLELKNISYSYEEGKKKILNNVNMKFESGKMYGIIGKSGAGKSTLLSLLSGLEESKLGDVLYQGRNLTELNRDDYRAKEIGIVFQGFNLILTATAIDNVILTMKISGINKNVKERAYKILESVGIDQETAKRKVLKLSGGEQQRVGIACAISNDSKILFADEPTGNLDGENENKILELFRMFAEKDNKCVIIVTHSKNVEEYVDELYGISGGRVNFITSH